MQDSHSADSLELVIGAYATLADLPARGRYGFDRMLAATVRQHTQAQGAALLEAALLQVLLHCPAGASRVYFFEAEACNDFAELKHLLAALPDLGQQWFNLREAVQGLSQLNETLLKRASLLAAARQPNLYQWNATRRTPEPVLLLVLNEVAAFAGQDATVLRQLKHMAQKGPQHGVIPVWLHSMDALQDSHWTPPVRAAFYQLLGETMPQALGFNLADDLPPYHLGQPYQQFVRDFGYVAQLPEGAAAQWTEALLDRQKQTVAESPVQDFLQVAIGESQSLPAFFALGQASDAFHALISGGSNSGKTTFLQNLILSICENYSPEDIQLLLLDYGTVSFGPYRSVAHVHYVFDQPQNGSLLQQVFQYLTDELHRRKEAFKQCGEQHLRTVDNLESYRRLAGQGFPALMLMVDEFGSLMANDNQVTARINGNTVLVRPYVEQCINLLVREGRKVGIHVVLITQSFHTVDRMPQDVKSNPHVAVGLKAEKVSDSRALLSSDNDAAYHIAQFQAVVNRKAGKPQYNQIVDLHYVPEDQIYARQCAVRERWPKQTLSALEQLLQEALAMPVASTSPSGDAPSWLRPAKGDL